MNEREFLQQLKFRTQGFSWGIKVSIKIEKIERLLNKITQIRRSEEQQIEDINILTEFLEKYKVPRTSLNLGRITSFYSLCDKFEKKYNLKDSKDSSYQIAYGLPFGVAMGYAFNNLPLGIAIGLAIGVSLSQFSGKSLTFNSKKLDNTY